MLPSIENIIFNGIDLAEEFTDEVSKTYLIVNHVRGRGVMDIDNVLLDVHGRPGAYTLESKTPPRFIDVDLTLKASSFEDLRKKIERLNSILDTGGVNVPIKFSDEPDRTYFGKLDKVNYKTEVSGIYQTSITLVCDDPYKYGPEKVESFSDDNINIVNEGTSPAKPVFELTAKESATLAMINTGNDFMMIGRDVSDEEVAMEPVTKILDESLNSLVGWADGVYVDNGVISGTMSTDSRGFYASDFGTGSGWFGPSKKRSLSEPVQDFEAQVYVENLNLAGGLGMIEVYFLDVNENTVAKLGIEDAWQSLARMQVKMQLGSPSNRHNIYGEPQRASHWYDYRGIMRIARRGNVWTAYFAVEDGGVYRYPFQTTPYIDYENNYSAPIAQVQISIRKRPTANATGMRVRNLIVNKFNVINDNNVPYIVNSGDVIILDHEKKLIMINGESRKDLKQFGAEYFELNEGDNSINVLPSGVYETIVKYREVYK